MALQIILSLVTIGVIYLLLTRLNTELGSSVNRAVIDMVDRMGKNFLETQERIDRTLTLGRKEQQEVLEKTTQVLDARFRTLEQQVSARLEKIGENVEAKLNENLKEGFKHFEKVQQHLTAAELKLASLNAVGQSISDLNNLLKLPHLRGGFGEASLERLLADFLPVGGFETQVTIEPGSKEKVDAVVKLAKQILPIDSKFPRDQIMPLFEANEPGALEKARDALADFVRRESRDIAKKYIKPEHGTTDMALLFLPSETLYFEVVRNGKVFDDMVKMKVYPVSPNTLAMGLRSVMMAQDYYDMAKGVEKTVDDLKKAKKHFEHFEKRFDDIGSGLRKAQEAFETAHTHLGRYETTIERLTERRDQDLDLTLPPGQATATQQEQAPNPGDAPTQSESKS